MPVSNVFVVPPMCNGADRRQCPKRLRNQSPVAAAEWQRDGHQGREHPACMWRGQPGHRSLEGTQAGSIVFRPGPFGNRSAVWGQVGAFRPFRRVLASGDWPARPRVPRWILGSTMWISAIAAGRVVRRQSVHLPAESPVGGPGDRLPSGTTRQITPVPGTGLGLSSTTIEPKSAM